MINLESSLTNKNNNMLEKVIKRKFYLQRHLDAPLLHERESYLEELEKRGNNRHPLKGIANYLLVLVTSFKLTDEDKSEVSLEEILQKGEEWSSLITDHPMKRTESPSVKSRFFCIALDWLTYIGRIDSRCNPDNNIISRLFTRGFHKVKHLTSPMFPERVAYLEYWESRGATLFTLRKIAQYQLHGIALIPEIKESGIISRQALLSAADTWWETELKATHKLKCSKGSRKYFISIVGGWLDFLNRLEEPDSGFFCKDKTDEYLNWLVEDKGYSLRTREHRQCLLKIFMQYLEKNNISLVELTPTDIDSFIEYRSTTCGCNRKSVSANASVLRDFLRYAASKNWCAASLHKSLCAPRVYTREDIPSFIPWDDMCRVVSRSANCKSHSAKRNHAIIMLLSVYGLRSSEVAKLKLADINWRQKQIYLRRAKLCKPQILPLNEDVAQSIIDYILNGRNNNAKEENLFLLTRAPYTPITASTVYQVATRALDGYGENLKHRGPHSYRHTCATHLVNTGHTMKEVGDVLGHQQLDTTQIYAKVDFENLRKVSEIDWEDLL